MNRNGTTSYALEVDWHRRMRIEKKEMKNQKTVKLAKMSVLVAIAVILVALIRFPIFPAAPFLEYDPGDVPIFIGAFAFGVVPGLVITAVVCIVQGLTVSALSGPIGILMHFVASGSFVLTAGLIYRKNKTKKMAVIALLCGTIVMTVMMALWNLFITPLYLGVEREAIAAMLLPVFIPFNLIRGLLNATITFLLYKRIAKYLHG